MAVRTREELISSLSERFGEDTSDEVISVLEDVTDTISDYETRISEAGDWKTKYEENDRSWREKYKSRFMSGSGTEETVLENDETVVEKTTFDDLFETN